MENLVHYMWWIAPVASVMSLFFAFYFYRKMMGADEGTPRMREIAGHVRDGAYAYLYAQYKVVSIVFVILFVVFAILAKIGIQNPFVPVAFLTGGFFSGLCGFLGMKTATNASARTAQGASESLNRGLQVAFRSGAVMGLVVVGFGLLDICLWYYILDSWVYTPEHMETGLTFLGLDLVHAGIGDHQKYVEITTTMLTFGMGASLQALFARVGGGIFTKAADVGADLVGKVEAGIPEDDPRNPATIADNVGDNVGDVAGMGADLYESYVGSILATAALGAAAFTQMGQNENAFKAVLAPMVVAAVGTILSIIGIFAVHVKKGASQKDLLNALGRGINLSSVLIFIASFFILKWLELPNYQGIWGAIVVGLLTGIVIGKATEYFTSQEYQPTRSIAESSATGPATVIISGLGTGMLSTVVPVTAVVIGTTLAYCFASGSWHFESSSIGLGLYGIGIAAVGMLSTLGITLATDAYGPIADNAGGNAEMAGLPPEVRRRTDALDSLGNTTAATGKGFAIGSAALTALALLASYVEELKIAMLHAGVKTMEVAGETVSVATATLTEFMTHFEVHLLNPKVILGVFVGSMMSFVFCGLTMNAVGRAAQSMVEEVRRQFREKPGILKGEDKPDYARCVAISTAGAQREMILPSMLAVFVPIGVGLLFGVPGVFGLLSGSLSSGFVLAVFMANSGGAWDNAKKYVEEGHLGGKGSPAHKATIIGDTIGDPFKDTSGPSLNILIKLMSMVSIVTAGVNIAYTLF
jgi:K(+)-stimulated pyrophosphate-energized sodium pump